MGISTVLETWIGSRREVARVDDPTQILNKLLPGQEDADSRFLRYVDWYGDTAFNRIQCSDLALELRLMRSRASSDSERDLVDRIIALAERCAAGQAECLWLRFVGD